MNGVGSSISSKGGGVVTVIVTVDGNVLCGACAREEDLEDEDIMGTTDDEECESCGSAGSPITMDDDGSMWETRW